MLMKKRWLAALALLALCACSAEREAPPAEEAEVAAPADTAAVVDTMPADTVMARDTADMTP
jgi:uncharacterized protein YcfL